MTTHQAKLSRFSFITRVVIKHLRESTAIATGRTTGRTVTSGSRYPAAPTATARLRDVTDTVKTCSRRIQRNTTRCSHASADIARFSRNQRLSSSARGLLRNCKGTIEQHCGKYCYGYPTFEIVHATYFLARDIRTDCEPDAQHAVMFALPI
jgi:hypothetical protein